MHVVSLILAALKNMQMDDVGVIKKKLHRHAPILGDKNKHALKEHVL